MNNKDIELKSILLTNVERYHRKKMDDDRDFYDTCEIIIKLIEEKKLSRAEAILRALENKIGD